MNSERVAARPRLSDSQVNSGSTTFIQNTITAYSPDVAASHDEVESPHQNRPIIWIHPATHPTSLPPINALPGDAAKAILSEIKTCAERLADQGLTHSIDLRFLKSTPAERAILISLLGRGEVSAIVNSVGRSEVQETAIPCVWWIRHYNSDDEIVGELIEISDVPNLLVGDRSAIAHSLDALYSTLHANALPGAC